MQEKWKGVWKRAIALTIDCVDIIKAVTGWAKTKPVLIMCALTLVLLAANTKILSDEADARRQILRMQESLLQKDFGAGVYQAQQKISDDMKADLRDQLSHVLQDNKKFRAELKDAVVEEITRINVQVRGGDVAVHEIPTESVDPRRFFMEDRFVRMEFDSQGGVFNVAHAPVSISIVDIKKDGVRKQLAVVKGGWDGQPIDDVEISRVIPEQGVFRAFISAELFVASNGASFVVKRHINPWLSYGGGATYQFESGEVGFGVAGSLNLFLKPR